MSDKIAKLEKIDIRKVWDSETQFTEWLCDNLDILKEQLGFELVRAETEAPVGSFSADLIATDESGRIVVIENQLKETDHDHLGKLLTYLSVLNIEGENAKIGIWIASEAKEEHIKAVEYLNKICNPNIELYLIKIQLLRIENSNPAPLFTIEAGPIKGSKRKNKEIPKDKDKYFKFFELLLQKCKEKTKLFNNVSPVWYQYWLNAGAGKSGVAWSLVILKDHARVELFFCHSDKEINKNRFNFLAERKDEIENKFGEPLEWDFKEERKQQYIRTKITIGGWADEDKWDEIQEEMLEKLIKLERIFTPLINKLPK